MNPRRIPLLAAALILAACTQAAVTSDPDPVRPGAVMVGEIRYQAETAILESYPVQLRTTVSITNTGARPDTLQLPGGCPVLLRAYRDPGRTGTPAWDQERDIVCTLQLLLLDVAPGQTRTLEGRATAHDILGDSLPNGRYYLTAVLRPENQVVELEAGDTELVR